jgi:DNA repair protein RecO (recombination protein O)
MSLFKSDGIILRYSRSGESSLLVYVFLRDGGRENLLAKGARNPKSALVGKLEPFSVAEVLYYRSDPEKLGVVSQVEPIRTFPDLGNDIKRLSYASALVEAIESLVPRSETNHEVYDLLNDTLYQINYCHGSKLEFFLSAFVLKLLSLSGFHPEFSSCIKTGVDLSDADVAYFSPEDGGLVSPDAATANGKYYKLNKGTRKALNAILTTEISNLGGMNFSNDQKKLVRALLLKFLAVHTERPPAFTSLDFLARIKPNS